MKRSLCRMCALMSSFIWSAAQALECPAFIAETSVKLVDTPAGWTAFSSSPLYLHGAAPMSGPPEKLGVLADYHETKRNQEISYTYQLDGHFPEGKWLACTYGEGDQVTLSKRLDNTVRVCIFRYRKGKHVGQNDVAISCK